MEIIAAEAIERADYLHYVKTEFRLLAFVRNRPEYEFPGRELIKMKKGKRYK